MRTLLTYIAAAVAVTVTACGGTQSLKPDVLAQAGAGAFHAAALSDADIKSLSDQSCASTDGKSRVASAGDKYTVRLNAVMRGMPSAINGQPINYKVYLTKDVNAWAMANGCIRVYSGLMDIMNDGELRGVIGHEEGHVALGHTKKAMQIAYSASAARQLAGASGGVAASLSASQLGDLTERLINAQFSQSQESDADNYSFDLLTRQGLHREGLVTAFQKLAKLDGGKSSMFSSHPSSAERAANLQKRIDKSGG